MANHQNHYEAAFQDYLRSRGLPYVPVDERRKAIFSGARIKSFDFLVYPPGGKPWLVDVKGRKFPYEGRRGLRYWENWVTREDLEGLRRWEQAFGEGFEPMLVFVYWLMTTAKEPTSEVHSYRGRDYAFLTVPASDYADRARLRSPKWDTLAISRGAFRSLARPMPVA